MLSSPYPLKLLLPLLAQPTYSEPDVIMLIKTPTKRVSVIMTGSLGKLRGRIQLGLHLLEDEKTLNVEYRNRSIIAVSPPSGYSTIEVSTLAFDTIDWQTLSYPILEIYPEELDNVTRLGSALNYLSMYEFGVSEMMSLINIRQNLLLEAEMKVIPYKPELFLTNVSGRAEPAPWSAASLNRTIWA